MSQYHTVVMFNKKLFFSISDWGHVEIDNQKWATPEDKSMIEYDPAQFSQLNKECHIKLESTR